MEKYIHIKDIPLFSTILVFIIGIWGAILNFSKREELKRDIALRKKITLFILDLTTSGGFALLTFYGCLGYGITEPLAVAIAGIVGHQGTRAMYLLELIIAEKFGGDSVVNAIKEKNGNK